MSCERNAQPWLGRDHDPTIGNPIFGRIFQHLNVAGLVREIRIDFLNHEIGNARAKLKRSGG